MKKAYKRSPSKATRRALGRRGGFAPSGRSYQNMPVNEAVGKTLKNRTAGAKSPGKAFARDLLKLAAGRIVQDIAGTVYQRIEGASSSIEGGNTDTVGATSETVVRQKATGRVSDKIHKTKFVSGPMPTSTINRIAKNNGTERIKRLDTEVNQGSDSTNRQYFNIPYGFNQKAFGMFDSNSYWSLNDIYSTSGITLISTDSDEQVQKVYWCSKSFSNRYKILNTNKYLKAKVKIHLFKQNHMPLSALGICSAFGSTSVATPNTGAIPANYQLADRATSPGSVRAIIYADPKLTTIKSSESVNVDMTLVKTFSKTLGPSELWQFDHTHYTGPGMRMDNLFATKSYTDDYDPQAAAFYYPMFEVVGPEVECYDSQDDNLTFIGTGSGKIQFEFSKTAEVCLAQSDLSNISQSPGFTTSNWAYRIFNKYVPSLTGSNAKIFNVAYDNILRDGDPSATGKYIIPVATDYTITRGGKDKVAS